MEPGPIHTPVNSRDGATLHGVRPGNGIAYRIGRAERKGAVTPGVVSRRNYCRKVVLFPLFRAACSAPSIHTQLRAQVGQPILNPITPLPCFCPDSNICRTPVRLWYEQGRQNPDVFRPHPPVNLQHSVIERGSTVALRHLPSIGAHLNGGSTSIRGLRKMMAALHENYWYRTAVYGTI